MTRAASFLLLALVSCETTGSGVTATAPVDPAPQQTGKPSPRPGQPLPLPAKLVEGRYYVEPMTEDGQTLRLFTDTGGGLFLAAEAAQRLGLSVSPIEADGETVDSILLPLFSWDAWIPPPEALDGRMPLAANAESSAFLKAFDADGMLGQGWFKGRVWTFDYGSGQLLLRAPGDLPKHESMRGVPLGFKKNEAGQRETSYPRISVKIDGENFELLFDTGATVRLSETALAALADKRAATRATSFIAQTVFERWQSKHPDWRVIANADASAAGEPMIEVPAIEVAGFSVGPVWFTRRADKNFHEWMSQWMDQKIDGALGGSALQYFRVHVDYPRALAVFEKL